MNSADSDRTLALVAEMQRYYELRADVYDHSMGYDDPARVAQLEPVIAALSTLMRGRDVLEIACGPGFWTERVARVARHIVATDVNESTLALAKEKQIDEKVVTFRRADAYDLARVPGTFTGAFAVDWLAHVPLSLLPRFLDGLHQRLEPGAQIAFCDQLPRVSSFTGAHDHEGNHLQERILPDGSRHRVIKHFFSDETLRELFHSGRHDVSVQRFPEQGRLIASYTIS